MKYTNSFKQIANDFKRIYDELSKSESLSVKDFDAEKTVHIAVDMVNGFVKEGALASREVLSINDDVAGFAAECEKAGIRNYALCDSHHEKCTEFDTYPVHCVRDTAECELTDELKKAAEFKVFQKLSVNGWLEEEFQKDIIESGYDTFIITGDCTDMCVIQLALTLKSAMNRIDRPNRVIIPAELAATCSLPTRSPETGELAAFLIMQTNGIEIVKNIE